jgi:FkbM family methyltransferase
MKQRLSTAARYLTSRSAMREELEYLKGRVQDLAQAKPQRETFPIPYWYEWNPWEPTVQLPLRDLCRPGDTVFDVGANAGALTLVMSRLVGPRGVVCAFEASPRIVDKCQYNLAANGCANTQVYQRAIYHVSNELVNLYSGSHLNDSIVEAFGPQGVLTQVKTLALDDFVDYTHLTPSVIKMDIEGAEFDALQGMDRLLSSARPHLIVEQQPSDMRCHAFLSERGYCAVDLATYREVRTAEDFAPRAVVANLLFIHSSRRADTPYQPPFTFEAILNLPADAFVADASQSLSLREPVTLGPGRFIVDTDFTSSTDTNDVMAGVEADGREIFRYHTHSYFLSTSYRQWVIHLDRPQNINLFFRFLRATRDPTLDWRGARISRVVEFDRVPTPLVD